MPFMTKERFSHITKDLGFQHQWKIQCTGQSAIQFNGIVMIEEKHIVRRWQHRLCTDPCFLMPSSLLRVIE